MALAIIKVNPLVSLEVGITDATGLTDFYLIGYMKLINYIAAMFYRYYSTGPTRGIPYFSAICALVTILYIHLFQVLILINMTYLIPIDQQDDRPVKYLKMALFFLPIYLVFFYLIKPKQIKKIADETSFSKKEYFLLILYIVLSFIILILLMLWKKNRI